MSNATNTFTKGLSTDLSALATPENQLIDAVNATLLTFNGNEMSLQNDMGNARIVKSDGSYVKLPTGFIPIGVKEYGGIIYFVLYNKTTKETEIGSFPGPQHIDIHSKEFIDITNTSDDLDDSIISLNDKLKAYIDKVVELTDTLGPGDLVEFNFSNLDDTPNIISSSDVSSRKTFKIDLVSLKNNKSILSEFIGLPLINADGTSATGNITDIYHNHYHFFYPNIVSGKIGMKICYETIDYANTAYSVDSNGDILQFSNEKMLSYNDF